MGGFVLNNTDEKVATAKLIPVRMNHGTKCSNCGARHKNCARRTHNYCYKCGAKFIKDRKNEIEAKVKEIVVTLELGETKKDLDELLKNI